MSKITAWRIGVTAVVVLALGAGYLWGHRTGSERPAYTSLVTPAQTAVGVRTGPATGSAGAGAGISVNGSGVVSGTPDTLQLAIGVDVLSATVEVALDGANRAAGAVQKSLRDHGVAEKDLQTSGLSVQPNYTDSAGQATISGYRVSETLTAALRDIKTAGAAITAAARAGGNATRIQSVNLDLSDTSALVAKARERAFAQAKSKAEQYAHTAGVDLGAVLSIQESAATPGPIYAAAGAADARAAAVPIATGSQNVTVDVSVLFAIN